MRLYGVMENTWDGEKFRRQREALGLTQRAMAELVGVSGQALGKWERNESTPTYRHLQRIHAVLSGDVAETPTQLRAVIEAQQLVLAALAAQGTPIRLVVLGVHGGSSFGLCAGTPSWRWGVALLSWCVVGVEVYHYSAS